MGVGVGGGAGVGVGAGVVGPGFGFGVDGGGGVAAWVIETERPATDKVVERAAESSLAATISSTSLVPAPDFGDTVTHAAGELAVQLQPIRVVTFRVPLLPSAGIGTAFGLTENVHGDAACVTPI